MAESGEDQFSFFSDFTLDEAYKEEWRWIDWASEEEECEGWSLIGTLLDSHWGYYSLSQLLVVHN